MSRTLIAPSLSSRTVKDGAVVVIGVDRGRVGGDNGACWRLLREAAGLGTLVTAGRS